VYDILSKNLPLKASELESRSPVVKPLEQYPSAKILFLPNSDAEQSRILFYAVGPEFTTAMHPSVYAFNQYFGGGFGGLVLDEIREKNSMAYYASGGFSTPVLPNEKSWFFGSLGTQADKTADAVELYMRLIGQMPEYPDRMDNIRSFIMQALQSRKPSFRIASQVFESWKLQGYHEDPARSIVPALEKISFDDITNFYNGTLKNAPVVIGIIGNPRMIDLKALEKYGPVERITSGKIFK
jgi:zinc protease